MFEQASRIKLRVQTNKGLITVEDLWDLGIVTLDKLAVKLYKELQESNHDSFIEQTVKKDEVLQLQFDVVKHILDVKVSESNEKKKQLAIKAQKDKLLELIQEKKESELKSLSVEDLEKQLASLE